MSFSPRSFPIILEDMIAYVRANSTLSDFTVGSMVRSILEAAAYEDDEQYFQMTQLLAAFSILNAKGNKLDRRMADYGLVRLRATKALVPVRFYDTSIITNRLATDVASGATSIELFNSSGFPTSGFPYTVRIGEGTTRLQDVVVTAHNTAARTLTLSAPVANDLVVGDRVNLLTGAVARSIGRNTMVNAPATVTEASRIFSTTTAAFIAPGNFFSNEVFARATVSGSSANVGRGKVSQFSGAKPFQSAGVTNLKEATPGTDRESDADFLDRGLQQLQSLSRGTPLAIRSNSVGVTDPTTGQRTVSSNIVEDFANAEVLVYIDNGVGLVPSAQSLPSASIVGATLLGVTELPMSDTSDLPSVGTYLIESGPAELVEVTSKDDSTNRLLLASGTTNIHSDSTTVSLVDVLVTSAEAGRRRFRLQNYPVVRGTERVYVDGGGGIGELTPGVDYVLNRGTGELQMSSTSGVAGGAIVFAQYSYYTNLIAEVQKVLEGDEDDANVYPGVKAGGIFLSVEAPTIRRISVTASISAKPGFVENTLRPLVQQEIEAYVSSRKLGEDVIISNMVSRALTVDGVLDIRVSSPTNNISVLENELPIARDSDGNSLVSIV